jgi:hypothetical protein
MPPSIPNEQTRESESDLEPTGEVCVCENFVCVDGCRHSAFTSRHFSRSFQACECECVGGNVAPLHFCVKIDCPPAAG